MRILVVDCDPDALALLRSVILEQHHHVSVASSGRRALDLAAVGDFDLVFCDVKLNGMTGFDVLAALRSVDPNAEIVLMASQPSIEDAENAIRLGARDYTGKPPSRAMLQSIAAGIDRQRHIGNLIEVQSHEISQPEMLGSCKAIIDVVKTATRVAATELSVMIRGESGTGKELIGRLIHRESTRAAGPFVAVNCGAMPDTLIESELFGHSRGAFTGASSVRRGLFEEAHGGTLLLDEVTETSHAFQVKLLRAIEEGEIRPLGSELTKKVNVRVVSTTNRDVDALVKSGLFRQDLLYRLCGVSLTLPPLRERREDIRSTALAFLSRYRAAVGRLSITKDAMFALEGYSWPGNVRELKHTMQCLAALSSGIIRLEDLPPDIVSTRAVASILNAVIAERNLPTLKQLESRYLLGVLSAVGGNKSRAAEVIGVDRKTLSRRIDGLRIRNSAQASDRSGECLVNPGLFLQYKRIGSASVA